MSKFIERKVNYYFRVNALRPSNNLSVNLHVKQGTIYNSRKFSSVILTDKQLFILNKWQTDFPAYSDLNYKEIAELASKSNQIGVWFNKVSEDYALQVDAPDWYLTAIGSEENWSTEFRSLLNKASELTRDLSKTSNDISVEARKKLDAVNKKYEEDMVKLFSDNPELLLHYITTQTLSLDVHIKAMAIVDSKEAKTFLRNELDKKRVKLFNDYKDGKVSVEELVSMLFVK